MRPTKGHNRFLGKDKVVLNSGADIVRLTPENATFSEKNGFIALTFSKNNENISYSKVSLRRCFPFELKYEYISVLDEDGLEIGLIYNLSDFANVKDILEAELTRRYFEPQIESIVSIKERYGFSYWKVMLTDKRKTEFTMQDTFRNIIRIEQKAILLDVDCNRFVIQDISALDKRSFKKFL